MSSHKCKKNQRATADGGSDTASSAGSQRRGRGVRSDGGSSCEDGKSSQDSHEPWTESHSLASVLEDLSSSHTQKRHSALVKLQHNLQHHYLFDEAHKDGEELCEALLSCIRIGPNTDSVLAASVLGLVFLTLGEESCKLVCEHLPALFTHLKSASDDGVRASVAAAAAMGILVSELLPTEIAANMHKLARFFSEESEDAAVKVASLKGWGLLASLLPPNLLLTPKLMATMPTLKALLNSDDLEVKIAAGENISSIYEAHWRIHEEKVDDFQQSLPDAPVQVPEPGPKAQSETPQPQAKDDIKQENTNIDDSKGASSDRPKKAAPPPPMQWNDAELLKTLSDLSKQSSKKMSKADRLQQHTMFRYIHASVESRHGRPIRQHLRTREFETDVTTWRGKLRLEAFRALLQSGFHAHLGSNPLLRAKLEEEDEEECDAAPPPPPPAPAAGAEHDAHHEGKGGAAAAAAAAERNFERWLVHTAQVKARSLEIRNKRDQCRRSRYVRELYTAEDG